MVRWKCNDCNNEDRFYYQGQVKSYYYEDCKEIVDNTDEFIERDDYENGEYGDVIDTERMSEILYCCQCDSNNISDNDEEDDEVSEDEDNPFLEQFKISKEKEDTSLKEIYSLLIKK